MSFVPNGRSEKSPTLHRHIWQTNLYKSNQHLFFYQFNWHQIEYIILWRYFEQSTVVEAVEIKNWGFACSNRSAVIYKFPISEYIVKSANSSTLNKIGLALNSDFCKGLRPKNSTNRLTQSDLLLRWPAFADIDSDWFSNWF